MPRDSGGQQIDLSPPQSTTDLCYETVEHKNFLKAVSKLDCIKNIPPVVLGITRHIVLASAQESLLRLLPLVTSEFWKSVEHAFQPFVWKISNPNDVSADSENFEKQSRFVTSLFLRLENTGSYISAITDKKRRESAASIIAQIAELRRLISASSGFTENGDYLGLLAPSPWHILSSAAILRAHEIAPPESKYVQFKGLNEHDFQAVAHITLQELLEAVEQSFSDQSQMELSRNRQSQGRHRRFAQQLVCWFEEVAAECGETTPAPKTAIIKTTSAMLEELFPDQPELIQKRPIS